MTFEFKLLSNPKTRLFLVKFLLKKLSPTLSEQCLKIFFDVLISKQQKCTRDKPMNYKIYGKWFWNGGLP